MRICVTIGLLCVSFLTHSHETWLLPESFVLAEPGRVQFSLASGMEFGGDGVGIEADRIIASAILSSGDEGALRAGEKRPHALLLEGELQSGNACAYVQLAPRYLELDPESIEHYFDEIGASRAIREAWYASDQPERWRESYSKLAKTFLRTGAPVEVGSPCWKHSLGEGLELIPLSDPTDLRAGQRLSFRVLRNGERFAGQAVGVVRAGEERGELAFSASDGLVDFTFDQPGTYLLYATVLRRVERSDLDWESDFTTITLAVK